MRYSRLFGKTQRDKPRNADSLSHQLLLRAGFLKPVAGGFALLPPGERALARLAAALTREWRAAGFQRVVLPAAASEAARDLEFRRRESGEVYPFAAQHEAALGLLAGHLSLSYRELPLLLACSRWANRAEARPNWGLLLAPEFLCYSAYMLCQTEEQLAAALDSARCVYARVLERVGLATSVLGDEIVITTDLPARPLLACDACDYQADAGQAVSLAPEWPQQATAGEMRAVHGPGLIQVGPLSEFLGIPVHQTTKTLLFQAGERLIAACVPGVYDVSEAKLARVAGARRLELASVEVVRELTQAEVGYAGPIGLPATVEVIWDLSAEPRVNFEAGANRTDHHLINVNFGRDVARPDRFHDIRVSLEGERCARCGEGRLAARRALALGHASRVGTLYSETLGATFLDSDKTTKPMLLGCAALDLTCALAAIVDQHHDARGIVWPAEVAPFAAHLVSLPPAEDAAAALYRDLTAAGVDVLWDDRPESAGVKFGDADLIGVPVRLVLSKRTAGQVEWKLRNAPEGELISPAEALERLSPHD